ncbi:hypothetical protein E4K10_40315 [Streptomyces sp. T1317-0309]|nr:hypothetical protein E4K10_40315 [Streptomyces sp. T1317-0309]
MPKPTTGPTAAARLPVLALTVAGTAVALPASAAPPTTPAPPVRTPATQASPRPDEQRTVSFPARPW